jgi:acetylornithine deacetylase/succinyl-diaminopimelate desuccinylase-like protein
VREIINRIDHLLQQNIDLYIEETAKLCAQPSVSAKGEGLRDCAELVAVLLENHGFSVKVHETPGFPIVVGRITGVSDRTLLFYNHYDVQPAEPLELWTTPPFEPVIRDGALYARGAKDDKGEFVARLAAVEAVRKAHNGELPCGITFVVEGQEEVSSPHIYQFVQEHLEELNCDGSIWEEGGIDPEGRPVCFLGGRGILYIEIRVRTLSMDAHSGSAHVLPNAAWRLHRVLGLLKSGDEQIQIPGFYEHALPPSELDLNLLDAMPTHEDIRRRQYGVSEFVRGVTGKELNRALFEPTCNIAGLKAGHIDPGIKTVIPATASVKIDFRLVPDQDPEDIFHKIRDYLDQEGFEDVELERMGAMWPSKTNPSDPLVGLTTKTGEEVYGKPSLLVPMVGGSSPMYAFAKPLGNIPIVRAGVGYWGSQTHAPNEHVRIDDFLNGSRHIARIINDFADLS